MSTPQMNAGNSETRILGLATALSIVIANMIGTGIFTTTGFLVEDIKEPFPVLVTWMVGGLIALCGALTYAELGAAMPRSGGEYHYLSRLYHPLAGFLSGWISMVAGFSAPIAAVAVAFAKYLHVVLPQFPVTPGALLAVAIFSFFHWKNVKLGGHIQNYITWLKVLLILALIIGGIIAVPKNEFYLSPSPGEWDIFFNPAFATGLIYVMYSYSGWNAAAYLGGEIKRPSRNLPMALIGGTLIVTLLYAGLKDRKSVV